MVNFPKIKGRIRRIQTAFLFGRGIGLELVLGQPIRIRRVRIGLALAIWQIIHLQNTSQYRIIL
jgi:hypothetical protein